MLTDFYSLVETVAGSVLMIWGIALLVNKNVLSRMYKAFTTDINQNEVLTYLTATMFLILGLIIVWTHNDWYWGSSLIVTLLGWLIVVKTFLWMTWPKKLSSLAQFFSPWINKAWFQIAYGILIIVLGLIILSKYFIHKLSMFIY